jgi:hypothetical protein
MARAIAHQVHLLQQGRGNALRFGDAAAQHRPHNEEIPEPHHRLADERDERCVSDDPTERRAPRHAAALGIVVGIDGDDPRDTRVTPSGDDEDDGAPDRYAGQRDVAQIEFGEKAFDRFGEERCIITSGRDIRIAMPRIVKRIDGEVLGGLGDDFSNRSSCVLSVWSRTSGGPLPDLM